VTLTVACSLPTPHVMVALPAEPVLIVTKPVVAEVASVEPKGAALGAATSLFELVHVSSVPPV
jgi:hypothetical protein